MGMFRGCGWLCLSTPQTIDVLLDAADESANHSGCLVVARLLFFTLLLYGFLPAESMRGDPGSNDRNDCWFPRQRGYEYMVVAVFR